VRDPAATVTGTGKEKEMPMSVNDAFNDYQRTIDEDPAVLKEARARRDAFKTAFNAEADVREVWSSGSLRRSTQLAPLNDVDLVVVYDATAHPTWGSPGDSAEESLEHVRARTNALLGITSGTSSRLVRRALPRNHAVKSFIDAPDSGFTVDAMPALRQPDGTLLIPEKLSKLWVPANPEYLIKEVQDRHDSWSHYRPMVRVLKDWRLDAADAMTSKVKSLVIEILALTCLPTQGTRAQALAKFFEMAALAAQSLICDPANLCGEVQPDLDYAGLRDQLNLAAQKATQAVLCESLNDIANAQRLWRDIFGDDFPAQAGAVTIGAAGAGAAGLGYQPVKDSPQG
jgi:hypothetical protein